MAEKQKIKYNKGVLNLDKIKQELNEIGLDRVFEWYGIDIKGKNAINCVFHDENTPSLKIYDDKNSNYERNMWHCFGECSTGGDGFYFILKQEKDFFKAVQVASDITGIEADMNISAEAQLIMSKIEQFNYKLNWEEFAPYAYRYSLEGETTPFEQFLEERCISIETARRYGLGYADEKGYGEFSLDVGLELGLITETEEGFNADKLIETGLFRRSDKGEEKGMFPTLLNCVTIPIHDDKGNIVGFEGRRLNKDDAEKYGKYNKSATKFFLFNSDVVDKYESVFIFEGAIDTLTAIQCGFPNSIGLLGVSSLGAEEKAVLSRVKGKIFIHMDDDSAGQTKADELLLELGHKAYKVPPINVGGEIKDLNDFFVSLYQTNINNGMTEEDAFEKAMSNTYTNIDNRIYGRRVKDEDGYDTYDDNDEIIREESNTKNLVQISLEEWENDGCKPEQFQDLIKVIYQQYEGQSALIGSFKNLIVKNKDYGISAKVFDDTVKEVKGEVALTVRNSSNIQNYESPEIRYEVINNILYKMTPVIMKGEVLTEKMDEISTTVPIIKGILYDKTDDKEKVEIEFTNNVGQIIKIITPRENILKKNSIIDALGSKGLDVTDVTSQDIILWLRQYTKENSIPRKELVKMTGLYKVDGQYYYIGQLGEIVSEKGLIDDFSLVYHSKLIDRSIKEITEVSYDEWKQSVNAIPLILKLNERKNSLTITSYMLSSIFREYFYNMRGAFSTVQIRGLKGSGKTTIVKPLMRMICGHNKPLQAKSKRFPLTSNLTMSNAFPLVIDEYKASDMKYHNGDLMYLIKTTYDSSKDEKGTANQELNRYVYHRPILVVGENMFYGEDSDAVKERAGIITFTNTWLKENRRKTKPIVNKLNKMDLSKFTGGYLQFALKLLNSGRVDEIFDISEKRAYEFSDNYGDMLTDRHILTMTILAFGIELIKELYKEVGIESDIIEEDYEEVFKNALNHAINENDIETSLDRTMRYVATTLIREFPEDEKSFDASKHILYLSRTTFLELLEINRFQHKADIPEKSGLIQYIDDSYTDEEGYIIEKSKGKTINGKTIRCIWIDTKKLSKVAHIDEATWLGTKGKEKEDFHTNGTSSRVHNTVEGRNMSLSAELSKKVISTLEKELNIKISGNDKNVIRGEIYGILTERTKNGKVTIKEGFYNVFVEEMLSKYKEQFESREESEISDASEVLKIIKGSKIG